MNEEKIRKMVSDSFFENIMNNLDSSIIFKYIEGLEKENQKLKKDLKELEETSANAINKQGARGIDLVNQQKGFTNWLEKVIAEVDNEICNLDGLAYNIQRERERHLIKYNLVIQILDKYKEIIGSDK